MTATAAPVSGFLPLQHTDTIATRCGGLRSGHSQAMQRRPEREKRLQVVSLAAVGLTVDPGATSEAAAACDLAAQLLNELFPAVLAALRHEDDAAAMSVVPFLQV